MERTGPSDRKVLRAGATLIAISLFSSGAVSLALVAAHGTASSVAVHFASGVVLTGADLAVVEVVGIIKIIAAIGIFLYGWIRWSPRVVEEWLPWKHDAEE